MRRNVSHGGYAPYGTIGIVRCRFTQFLYEK
jgi:hypothetical protein